jgi:hypothetical protein
VLLWSGLRNSCSKKDEQMTNTPSAGSLDPALCVVTSVQDIPLNRIRESCSNPRRTFDEGKPRELADFVPGNKIGLMLRRVFCAHRPGTAASLAEGGVLMGT